MNDRRGAPLAVGLGEILWDLLPQGRQLGGAPANFAYHARALGGRGAVASAVGDDEPGREILARLDSLGVDRSAVFVDTEHPTGAVTVELDAAGLPQYTIHEDAAWDFIPTAPELLSLARRADAVCFGSLAQRSAVSRKAIREFLAATKRGCLRVFDVNLRQSYYESDVLAASLRAADVLKLNADELPIVAELFELAGEAEQLPGLLRERFDLELVAVTRGSQGSLLVSRHEVSLAPPQRVRVVDTVGAGDAFTAALVLGLLRGAPLDACHRHAARVAAYVCTQAGATPELPAEIVQPA